VANTHDTVTIARHEKGVEVRNRSDTDAIYVRFDTTTPTVAGDNTYYVAPGETYYHRVPGTLVKLISSGNAAYSVQGVA